MNTKFLNHKISVFKNNAYSTILIVNEKNKIVHKIDEVQDINLQKNLTEARLWITDEELGKKLQE